MMQIAEKFENEIKNEEMTAAVIEAPPIVLTKQNKAVMLLAEIFEKQPKSEERWNSLVTQVTGSSEEVKTESQEVAKNVEF